MNVTKKAIVLVKQKKGKENVTGIWQQRSYTNVCDLVNKITGNKDTDKETCMWSLSWKFSTM